MGRCTQLERIEVSRHRRRVDPHILHPLHQKGRVVDTLCARKDFFTAHKEIVRVGEGRVNGVGHGVKGTDGKREFVEDKVVGVVFFTNQSTE